MSLFDDTPVRTPADELLDLIKRKGKLTVEQAAKHLKMPSVSVQGLVDFLVEEKILGIEYKFTTPYIYLNDITTSGKTGAGSVQDALITKEQFWEAARKKGLPTERIDLLWKKYLQENLSAIRNEFNKQASLRGLDKAKTEDLWQKYLNNL